jgi:hypothetical protein
MQLRPDAVLTRDTVANGSLFTQLVNEPLSQLTVTDAAEFGFVFTTCFGADSFVSCAFIVSIAPAHKRI